MALIPVFLFEKLKKIIRFTLLKFSKKIFQNVFVEMGLYESEQRDTCQQLLKNLAFVRSSQVGVIFESIIYNILLSIFKYSNIVI